MFNKSLLLVIKRKNLGPHTHIITCGDISNSRYGLWSYPNPGDFTHGSSIEPLSLFSNHNIIYLYTGTSNKRRITQLTVKKMNGSIGNLNGYGAIYIGRYDTKESYKSDSINSQTVLWSNTDFFKESDVGKPLAIWLSNTPPPWL